MVGWGSGRWSWEGWLLKWSSAMSGGRWWEGHGEWEGNAVVPQPCLRCQGRAQGQEMQWWEGHGGWECNVVVPQSCMHATTQGASSWSGL